MSRHKYSSDSLTYLSQKHYIFEKELSCKNCDPVRDTVTNVNLPFLVSFKFVCLFWGRRAHVGLYSAVKKYWIPACLKNT